MELNVLSKALVIRNVPVETIIFLLLSFRLNYRKKYENQCLIKIESKLKNYL